MIKESWHLLRLHKKTYFYLFGLILVVSFSSLFLQIIFGFISFFIEQNTNQNENIISGIGTLISIPFSLFATYLGILLQAVPAIYYEKGSKIQAKEALIKLFSKPLRYILAGILFGLLTILGYLFLFIPGVLISLVFPIYVNRIFNTEVAIFKAFLDSIRTLFKSEKWPNYLFKSLVASVLSFLIILITFGFGYLIFYPLLCFYLQGLIYRYKIVEKNN